MQKPRGSFNLQFVDGLTQNYRDITNIVVKLESSLHSSKDALLGKFFFKLSRYRVNLYCSYDLEVILKEIEKLVLKKTENTVQSVGCAKTELQI